MILLLPCYPVGGRFCVLHISHRRVAVLCEGDEMVACWEFD